MSDIFQTDEYVVRDNPHLDQGSSGGIGGDLDDLSDSATDITDNDKIATRQNSDGVWYKKTFAKVWDYTKSKIGISAQGSTKKYLDEQGNFTDVLSLLHPVGTIIESTTCDTEAKVKAAYGGTTWKQHSGYMLRGATSGVTVNSNSNDGGADSVTVSSVASHNHKVASLSGTAASQGVKGGCTNASGNQVGVQWTPAVTYVNNGSANNFTSATIRGSEHTHTVTTTAKDGGAESKGASYSVATLPKYKNVYIWERTA